MTLNSSTGELSGTPTADGTSNFTITATDANSATGARAYSLVIGVQPVQPMRSLLQWPLTAVRIPLP
ncbi:Ig domain-containing protein [Plesiomonas shigelloides]|uniref:Ig domain-containing protein n=1 Tax=Plesiomonas shigelloides TaxID=703 RepID=UPI0038B25872